MLLNLTYYLQFDYLIDDFDVEQHEYTCNPYIHTPFPQD